MFKKFVYAIVLFAIVLSLAACDQNGDGCDDAYTKRGEACLDDTGHFATWATNGSRDMDVLDKVAGDQATCNIVDKSGDFVPCTDNNRVESAQNALQQGRSVATPIPMPTAASLISQ